MIMEKFVENFPKVDQSQLMSDEELNSIEGGACSESCKQACQPGNMNGSTTGPSVPITVEIPLTPDLPVH
jgi:bacteriocin-like protein